MSNLVYYSLYFVSLLLTYYLNIIIIRYMSGLKFNFKISLIDIPLFLIIAIVSMSLDIHSLILIKNVVVVGSTVTILLLEYKIKFKKIFINYIVIMIFAVIFELLLGLIIGFVINTDNIAKDVFLLIRLLTNIYYYLLLLFILRLIKNRKRTKLNISVLLKILIAIMTLLLIVGTNNYLIMYNSNIKIYFLFWGLLTYIAFAMFSIFKLMISDYNKKVEIKNLKSKNSEVIMYIDEFKTYTHNLKYHLLSVKEHGNKEVNKQIDELLDSNNSELEYINNFKEVPSCLIHVFSHCLTITNDNNINIHIRNNYQDKELRINQKDYLQLNKIIGNCITNAIEALPKSNGLLLVEFYEINGTQYIQIVNNFNNSIDIEKIGSRNYSTKNRNSGFGLYSIFSCNQFEVNGKIINDYFTMSIKIPK